MQWPYIFAVVPRVAAPGSLTKPPGGWEFATFKAQPCAKSGRNKDLCGALESNFIRVFIQSFFAAAGRPPGSINMTRHTIAG